MTFRGTSDGSASKGYQTPFFNHQHSSFFDESQESQNMAFRLFNQPEQEAHRKRRSTISQLFDDQEEEQEEQRCEEDDEDEDRDEDKYFPDLPDIKNCGEQVSHKFKDFQQDLLSDDDESQRKTQGIRKIRHQPTSLMNHSNRIQTNGKKQKGQFSKRFNFQSEPLVYPSRSMIGSKPSSKSSKISEKSDKSNPQSHQWVSIQSNYKDLHKISKHKNDSKIEANYTKRPHQEKNPGIKPRSNNQSAKSDGSQLYDSQPLRLGQNSNFLKMSKLIEEPISAPVRLFSEKKDNRLNKAQKKQSQRQLGQGINPKKSATKKNTFGFNFSIKKPQSFSGFLNPIRQQKNDDETKNQIKEKQKPVIIREVVQQKNQQKLITNDDSLNSLPRSQDSKNIKQIANQRKKSIKNLSNLRQQTVLKNQQEMPCTIKRKEVGNESKKSRFGVKKPEKADNKIKKNLLFNIDYKTIAPKADSIQSASAFEGSKLQNKRQFHIEKRFQTSQYSQPIKKAESRGESWFLRVMKQLQNMDDEAKKVKNHNRSNANKHWEVYRLEREVKDRLNERTIGFKDIGSE